MIVIIDRFESQFAVCEKEDMTLINIERGIIPKGAKEGDVLIVDGKNINIDLNKTRKRKNEIEKLAEDLWE